METPVQIRSFGSLEDYFQTVDVQRTTWGPCEDDLVSPLLMKIMHQVGSIAAGAYLESGKLVGLVFGFPGNVDGRVVHWSHLLAVLPELRDRGIGLRLKEFQREKVLETGIGEMMWTYDPLESRNAHFNLIRLGVDIHSYQRDLYGSGENVPLFSGIGTDRFFVHWDLRRYPESGSSRQGRLQKIVRDSTTPDALAHVDDLSRLHHHGGSVTVRIPENIQEIKRLDPATAATWRSNTRAVFEYLLGRGFSVDGFVNDPSSHQGVYVMSPAPGPPNSKFPHSS